MGEIGIRMALGARPRDVAWPILRQAMLLATIGVVVAMPVILALSRVMRGVVYGIKPHDPLTMIGAAVLMVAVASLAAWTPARRAAKIDPMVALRHERGIENEIEEILYTLGGACFAKGICLPLGRSSLGLVGSGRLFRSDYERKSQDRDTDDRAEYD